MAETTRYYGTGKRKNAIAKVWLSNGQGNITVNNRTTGHYFGRASLEALIMQPFEVTETVGKFDVFVPRPWRRHLRPGRRAASRHRQSPGRVRSRTCGPSCGNWAT